MGDEDIDKSDTDAGKTRMSYKKIAKILVGIVALIVIIWIAWHAIIIFNGIYTEGMPNIHITEVNETLAASHKIFHPTDEEFMQIPVFREINPKSQVPWDDGYRELVYTKISEQQKRFLCEKYCNEDSNSGFFEYQGRYYGFAFSIS
jgi:hypothetical protein